MEKTQKSQRIVAILQLCLVFTLICWLMGYPFMGQLFATKSKIQLVETVMGTFGSDLSKMQHNKERFNSLPQKKQTTLHNYHSELSRHMQLSFSSKLARSFHLIMFEISLLERLWIVFSILVPLLILMRSEGGRQAAIILPLITLFYMAENIRFGQALDNSTEAKLFPSEKVIIDNHLKEPISRSIRMQKEQLTMGWQNYLISEWASEKPSDDSLTRATQVEKGEHAFFTARALAQSTHTPSLDTRSLRRKQPLPILLLYLLWNCFFSWVMQRRGKEVACSSC